jgi:hypothetical protein
MTLASLPTTNQSKRQHNKQPRNHTLHPSWTPTLYVHPGAGSCDCLRILHYRHAVAIAILSSFGGFLFGYDLGLMSGAIPFLREDLDLTNVEIELTVAMAKIGAFCGTFLGR